MTEIEFLTNPAEKISVGFKLIFKRLQKQDISCTRDYTLRFTSTHFLFSSRKLSSGGRTWETPKGRRWVQSVPRITSSFLTSRASQNSTVLFPSAKILMTIGWRWGRGYAPWAALKFSFEVPLRATAPRLLVLSFIISMAKNALCPTQIMTWIKIHFLLFGLWRARTTMVYHPKLCKDSQKYKAVLFLSYVKPCRRGGRSYTLLNIQCVPGTVLSTLHTLCTSKPTVALPSMHYFTDVKWKHREVKQLAQGHTVSLWQSQE